MAVNQNDQSFLNKSRTDKFKLVFSLPPALRKINSKTDRQTFNVNEDAFQFSVYGAVVPELDVPALQIRYGGSNLYNSTHAREPYPPVTIDFTIDNGFNNYWVLYKWLDLMHDEKEGLYDASDLVSDEDFKNYQTDMTLYGLDEFNNERIQFTYTKAFPVTIGSINYNYRTAEEITSSMTFVYSQIHTKLINY
jgi:hypothetical protein|tara:strand:+ start:1416 stop:1994 length:579 start_codon:yes stop_codon:yes gene_type:complete